jgi:hypothetical protein
LRYHEPEARCHVVHILCWAAVNMHAALDRSNQVLNKTGKSSFRIVFFGRSSYLKNLQNNDGHKNLKNLELIKREIEV